MQDEIRRCNLEQKLKTHPFTSARCVANRIRQLPISLINQPDELDQETGCVFSVPCFWKSATPDVCCLLRPKEVRELQLVRSRVHAIPASVHKDAETKLDAAWDVFGGLLQEVQGSLGRTVAVIRI